MFTSKFLSLVPTSVSEEQSLWIEEQLKQIYGQESPKYYEGEQTTEANFQTSLKQMVALLDFIVQEKPQYTLFSEYKKRVVKLPESPSAPERLATLTMAKKNLEESLWVVCHTPIDPMVINDYTVNKCYQGAASNIAMALNHFRVLGFESALIASKEKMLRNLILSFINEHQISPSSDNEIHYVNAFINLIAPTYGLQGVVDSFAPPSIPHKTIEQFYTYLETKLTITSLLSTLHTELPVSLPREPFDASNQSLFKLLEDYAEFITKDKRVHDQITKYLYEFLDDEGIMRPVQHFSSYLDAILVSFLERLGYIENQHLLLDGNKFIFNGTSLFKTKDDELTLPNAEEQQQIQEKLQCCLLGTDKLPDSLAISDDVLINLLDETTLWALFTANEATNNLKNRSILRLLQTNSSWILREPLRAWLQHTDPNKNGFLFLLNSRYYKAIQSLAEKNFITTEILRISPLRDLDQGINALWLLVAQKQHDILHLLIEQNHISTELLAASPLQGPDQRKNALWLLVAQEQFDVLRLLIEQNLISTELLASSPLQGPDKGINALWGLVEQKQFDVLRLLIEQNFISTELLAANPLHGPDKGKNALWMLIVQEQYDVLRLLIEQNLISTELLVASPLQGFYQGRNALWMLITQEQDDILRLLIEKNLISTELLAASPLQGPDKGANTLWGLLAQKQFDVLHLLIEQNRISTELLAAGPLQGENQGISTLWILIALEQYALLRSLIQQNFISTELLAASPLQGPNQGQNSLWRLVEQKQFDVVRLLIKQNLISTELLAATPLQGPNQGRNALWGLVEQKQFDVLRLLIEQNLISTELLATSPQQGPNQEVNTLWGVIEQNQFDVLRLLIEKNLISTELLAATPLQGPDQGLNALWGLVEQKQFDVLRLLIEKNRISTELLTACPQHGPCQGLNILWMLIAQKQYDVLHPLIEQNRISTELLAASPLQGPNQGINTLRILIEQKQFEVVLRPLIEKNLISTELLAATPLQGPNQGMNALWILIDQKQFNVLRPLIEQNLISTELLAATPLQGPSQGVNALWRLIEQNQVDVLRLLIEKNLITTELLKATCPQGPNRRKNALRILLEDHEQYALVSQWLARGLISMEQISIILWDMVQAQEWKKIERIVQANIITQESLRYTPPVINFKNVKSVPLLWMIAFEKENPKDNKSLWECMIRKNLITREDLSVSSDKGQSKGKNIVWLLANHGRWDTLLLLLNNKLITQEQLEKKPEIKSFIGNALYYLSLALKSNQVAEKRSAEQFQQAYQKTQENNNLRGTFFNKHEPGVKKRVKEEDKNSPQDNHQGSNAMNHSPN